MKINQMVCLAMEPIAYEIVSKHEARKALDDHRPAYKKNWDRDRLPEAPVVLLDATRAWLLELPETVRPVDLVKRYPRIANELAKRWQRTAQCERYLADLLIVRRGDSIRQGFPAPVAREITALSSFYAALHPAPASAWQWSADKH